MLPPELLGRVAVLRVLRFTTHGAYLALDADDARPDAPGILLPRSEVEATTAVGDALRVFVYLDSDDRPIATTRPPRLEVGEVAFLRVADVAPFGAFFEWGLAKDLLVPHAEQTREVAVGDRHPIALYVDPSGRLAGTMRVTERLRGQRDFRAGEWVEGEAWRHDPRIGTFVVVEKRYVGLVPAAEPSRLRRGDAAKLRVANVLADGKIELSTRGLSHEEVETDARTILDALSRPRTPKVGDKSSPEEIRAVFGLSKKAFKRAVGHLLKRRAVAIDEHGHLLRAETP